MAFIFICAVNRYFNGIAEKYRYDLFFTFVLGKKSVLISCPKLVEELACNPYAIDKSEIMYLPLSNISTGAFSHGPSNAEWKSKRKEINLSLKKSLIEGPYQEVVMKFSKELLQKIDKNEKEVDIEFIITSCLFDIVRETFFGMEHLIPLDKTLASDLSLVSHWAGKTMGNRIYGFFFYYLTAMFQKMFIRRAMEHRDEIISCIEEQMSKVVEGNIEEDMNLPLSVVMGLRNKRQNLPINELEKEIGEITVVTSHTVSVILTGAFVYLAMHPDIQDKVAEEQKRLFGDSTRDATADDLKQMPYLERFLKEVLRFLGPAWIIKKATGDINLKGMTVPAGTNIVILLDHLRKDPRYWSDPAVFDPDRFLAEDKLPRYSFAPFGVGIRSCPGMTWAYVEMKTIISTVIRKYKFSTSQKFHEIEYKVNLLAEMTNLTPVQAEKRQ